jgi:peptidyl-tRNA hydrolase
MAIKNKDPKNKKNIVALLAAFGMTLVMGILILGVGINALFFNKISPAQAAVPTSQAAAADQASIQQLQDLVSQYQSREGQYKSELQQATDSLNQANQQIQQYKQLTQALIDAGVIQINSNGQVSLGRGVGSGGGD